mmetsp:Transcript_12833/g.27975  ORF Transcript_12833/g.27975 Transcript_12833/m.27975 type:complete len:195 (-) Transcript_12833:1020-1604(-)
MDEAVRGLQNVEESLDEVQNMLSKAEERVAWYEKAVREGEHGAGEGLDERDILNGASAHVAIAFAISSLFYVYLRTQGIDTNNHPIMDEIGRVKITYGKVRAAVARLDASEDLVPESPAVGGAAPESVDVVCAEDDKEDVGDKERENEEVSRKREKVEDGENDTQDERGSKKRKKNERKKQKKSNSRKSKTSSS